ncbi:MAG: hypothetical protein IT371_18320 [Deltaproteobacteria bacterium]|nr:hypothetical protein [Deltaproteobacteria bacterium]
MSPARAEELSARRLVLTRGGLHAEGAVSLTLGSCRLRAVEAMFLQGQRLLAEQVCLEGRRLRLEAHRLELGPEGGLELVWPRLWPCGCAADSWAAPNLSARSARVASGGARLQLHWPVLRLGRVPVLAAPYLLLPLRSGTSGLGLPKVGYSARDGLRLEEELYLALRGRADALLAGGWVRGRGATGRLRLRYFTEEHGNGTLEFLGLKDNDLWRGRVRGRLLLRGARWAVGATPHVTSDPRLLGELARAPADVFASYQRSRAWAFSGLDATYGLATFDLFEELQAPWRRPSRRHGSAVLRLGTQPLPLVGPLLLEVGGELRHVGSPPSDGGLPLGGLGADRSRPVMTEAALDAALLFGGALGPVRVAAQARYRLSGGFGAPESDGTLGSQVDQGGLFSSEVALPLARTFDRRSGRVRHLVEPFLLGAAALGPLHYLVGPPLRASEAQVYGALGLRTLVQTRRAGEVIRRPLRAEAALGVGTRAELLVVARAELRAPFWLRASGEVLADPRARLVPRVLAELCVGPTQAELCGGFLHLEGENALTLLALDGSSFAPLASRARPLAATFTEQVTARAALRAGGVRLHALLAFDPRAGKLSYGRYGADLPLACAGCVRLGLSGESRPGSSWPDVFATVSYAGPAGFGCDGP